MATRSGRQPGNVGVLGAARTGWHKWASKHWGWFLPILATLGLVRGTRRTVRWSAPRLWRVTRWTMRHPARAVRWSWRTTRRSTGAGLNAMAEALDRAGKDGAALWARRASRRVGHRRTVTCAYCSAEIAVERAEAHINAHNGEAQRQDAQIVADRRGARVVPLARPSRPTPSSVAPASADRGVIHTDDTYLVGKPSLYYWHCHLCGATEPGFRTEAEANASCQRHVCPAAKKPTLQQSAPAAPANQSTSSGGAMSNTGTSETTQLMRAANGVGQMDPATAWELDAQLIGLSRAALVLTENLGQYIETLDRIKVDPRVTAQAGVAVGQVAEVVRTFAQARQLFRTLYADQFAAAENGVRQVAKKEFFDPRRAA